MRFKRKGVVLFIVLGTLLVVVILAAVILSLILSHSRLTLHQTSRIQAYSAALAGTNYALEMLRTGVWTYSPTNSCPDTNPATCIVTDSAFPKTIANQQVGIIFCPSGQTCSGSSAVCNPPPGYNFCINTTAIYTYTTP